MRVTKALRKWAVLEQALVREIGNQSHWIFALFYVLRPLSVAAWSWGIAERPTSRFGRGAATVPSSLFVLSYWALFLAIWAAIVTLILGPLIFAAIWMFFS